MRSVTETYLMYVVGIIIAVGFVSMVFMFTNNGKFYMRDSTKKLGNYTNILSEEKYRQYSGVNISGAQVITAITDMYDDAIPVRVQLTADGTYKEFNVSNITKAEEIKLAKENIKESAFYIGNNKIDSKTGAVTGVEFRFVH